MADIPESTKMLPCPFCGGPGHLQHSTFEIDAGWHVVCHGQKDCPLYCSEPYQVHGDEADAVTRWNTRAAPPAMDREAVARKFWLIIREPGRLPDRKGPWPLEQTASILREFMAANPQSFIDYLTIGPDGSPDVDHGPEVLQMTDGQSMSVGRKHNARVREAAIAALSTLSADAIRQGEGFVRMVSRLTHSGDDGWTPDDADDATQTLDGLIAKARTTISGHTVDCAWHVDQYPQECTCALATPASHASDGGKA